MSDQNLTKLEIEKMRREYTMASFDISDASANPFDQFGKWFNEAVESQIIEPNSMLLGTQSDSDGPTGRMVLLKGFDYRGFVFYTNYQSKKARQLTADPRCFLHFFWKELERQVLICGTAEKVSDQESDAYFALRPKDSQISAWASNQSSTLESRQALENEFQRLAAEFTDKTVPRPPFWGGFRVSPHFFEFWQGRKSRLHDRICYDLKDGEWQKKRLSP
ncbi:MAG TPA: pyridoxamine 5'-phosphate oxidase [Pyrinomonadaceae bacterium]|nr:pyridoxamine 5'-phosphate oxidase [Pyrinomonadaceae bacterium]